MAEIVTDKLVKFAFGTKANYSSAAHSDFVYFASDTPLIHAKGMWRGVSNVALSGNNLKITVGSKDDADNPAIILSADLSSIATTAAQRANWDNAYNFVKSITDTDTDDVINKWQEVVDFLAGIDGTTLQAIMSTKADKATKVFGLKGTNDLGGIKVEAVNDSGSVMSGTSPTLGNNFRIAINNQMTQGTYTKLTVDEFGLVNKGETLSASDIPSLAISKISGLQTALDGKMGNGVVLDVEYPLSITDGGKLSQSPTLSLNFDNATIVVDSSTHKLKVGNISASQISDLSSSLNGFVPTARKVIAGNGLSGGGALTADVTLSVKAANATISVASEGIGVASAPMLTTARNLWGNSFDGTANISGGLRFLDDNVSFQSSIGMRLKSSEGFIGFSRFVGLDGVGNFTGISLGWGSNPEEDATSMRINASTFTYKGNPIYYKGLAQFTTDVNSLISTALAPMATDFTALTNRVSVVESQLKWIEVS